MRTRIKGRQVLTQTFQASGAKTASYNTSSFDLGSYHEICMILRATVVTGTSETLDAVVQTSEDNTNWSNHTAFTQLTDVGDEYKAIGNFGKYVRVAVTIGGTTPSFTHSIVGICKA